MDDRNVKGWDSLVFLRGDTPQLERVFKRLTPSDLSSRYPSSYHFIVNKNIHKIPQGGAGALCFMQNQGKSSGVIGIIVKAKGSKALVQQLLPDPTCIDEAIILVDLHLNGFYLQQVAGPLLIPFSVGNHRDFPLLIPIGGPMNPTKR
jgi:hypothetical protein